MDKIETEDKLKVYRVDLTYFMPGTDLATFMEECEDDEHNAFHEHAIMLKWNSYILDRLANYCNDGDMCLVLCEDDVILVECNEDLGAELVEEGLLAPEECADCGHSHVSTPEPGESN